jgi:hypothetical protein
MSKRIHVSGILEAVADALEEAWHQVPQSELEDCAERKPIKYLPVLNIC